MGDLSSGRSPLKFHCKKKLPLDFFLRIIRMRLTPNNFVREALAAIELIFEVID
jgi:hypothetical protein